MKRMWGCVGAGDPAEGVGLSRGRTVILAAEDRGHVAIEGVALVHNDDAGASWCDRVSSSPKDTLSVAVHSQDPARLPVTAISRASMTATAGGA